MSVYIVSGIYKYDVEGSHILKIFLDKNKAINFRNNPDDITKQLYSQLELDEYEVSE